MISPLNTARVWALSATLVAVAACGEPQGAVDSQNAVIDPPAQCEPGRPDCSIAYDVPDGADLNEDNSAGIRYSPETDSLVVDRVTTLPDSDGDGVPDDADDCPGTPDWISCDNDPTNDGIYQTLFYDGVGGNEIVRTSDVPLVADIPEVDVYFLIDATPTLAEEIGEIQGNILTIIADVRASFPNARFGLGIYRQYPLATVVPAASLANPHSQAPYHHILDFTDDELLVQTAVSTLNVVANTSNATAATQALYSIATGRGLGDMVPNRGSCPGAPDGDFGYPCFRDRALHVVMNITDQEVYNGPRGSGPVYGTFAPGVGDGVTTLPPVEMFPELLQADTAALALDLRGLSGQSLTLMGMSTLLTDQVNTAAAAGCVTTSGMPPGADMDGKDVVLALRLNAMDGFDVFANNTHWPGANVALFDDAMLDASLALACDGGTVGVGSWGSISWSSPTSQDYYLVADGIIPASDPGHTPEGAFSLSIVYSGDPANPAWLTSDAPVAWSAVEAALLADNIRVASVVTLRDAMSGSSAGRPDADEIALITDARTRFGGSWVTELGTSTGDGIDAAISNTIALARDSSRYHISLVEEDNPATPVDEREFIGGVRHQDCADGDALTCSFGSTNRCLSCDLGADLEYRVLFANRSVPPTGSSQVYDFELVASADNVVEVERIPVRVMIPDADSHEFDETPGTAFYRNVYDSTERCITPPEHPKWDDLIWEGSTPESSSIDFQIRTAASADELALTLPVVVSVSGSGTGGTIDVRDELIAGGQTVGLPYIQITAVLNPGTSPPATPTLTGWSFQYFCEAAQ